MSSVKVTNSTTRSLVQRRRHDAGRPLIATHRGTAAGCIFSNTVAAAQLALASGSDIVELDVVRSRDGQYFTFHDGYESCLLGASVTLEAMDGAQVAEQRYGKVNGHDGVCGVERYSDVLAAMPGTLINVDRSYRYWEEGFLTELMTWANADDLLLKSPVREEYLTALARDTPHVPYIPIVTSRDDVKTVLAWQDLTVVGLEIIAEEQSADLADPHYVAELKDRGLLIWLNAINLENGVPLYCGWDDLTSIRDNPDAGWGRLVRQGADIIQTDVPWLLRSYLDSL